MTRPTFRELMVWMACTEATARGRPNTIVPLADYLLKVGELTPFLREWFTRLLTRDPSERHHLRYQSRPGRRSQSKEFPVGAVMECDLALRKRLLTGNFCEVLAAYIGDGRELSIYMREWIAKLLNQDKSLGHYLRYTARAGRRTSKGEVLKGMFIDGRAAELHGRTITAEFCQNLEKTLQLYDTPVENRQSTQVYRFGILVMDQWGTGWVKATLTLRTGKTLNTAQIQTIVASEFGMSLSTAKRILVNHENARRIT
jgi:hypothetical protein